MVWADDVFKPEHLPTWLLTATGVVATAVGGLIVKGINRWRKDSETQQRWMLDHIKQRSDEARKDHKEEVENVVKTLVTAFEGQQGIERETCERRHKENSEKLETFGRAIAANQQTLTQQNEAIRVALAERAWPRGKGT